MQILWNWELKTLVSLSGSSLSENEFHNTVCESSWEKLPFSKFCLWFWGVDPISMTLVGQKENIDGGLSSFQHLQRGEDFH